jgi:hypothetical protein
MSITVMKQALEALETATHQWEKEKAITSLRQAIAEAEQLDKLLVHQPMLDLWQRYCDKKQEVADLKEKLAEAEKHEVSQEPVAWFRNEDTFGDQELEPIFYATKAWDDCQPLYTHPQPKREPLTDEQILSFVNAAPALDTAEAEWLHVARAIEAAHGIKGD